MATFTNNTAPGFDKAIVGVADSATGIDGSSNTVGVHGISKAGPDVQPRVVQLAGVRGDAEHAVGVFGKSKNNTGVAGESDIHYGVAGESTSGVGVFGSSQTSEAIHGETNSSGAAAVIGINNSTGPGVRGYSTGFDGISGESKGKGKAGVVGVNANGIGVIGIGPLAGLFDGNVEVTGDITLTGADCAEDFDMAADVSVDPGTVVVLGEDGALSPCHRAYDTRVVGVVSGAGGYKPGIVLDKQQSEITRQPIALLGKVYCKVDAQYGAIAVGDLLTTSDNPGHAMKATDPVKAFGSVIGKALRPFKEGQQLIPVLITLQ